MNSSDFFKVEELSDSIGVDIDVTGEISPVFDEAHARRVIEAVLFAAGHPVTYAKLAEVLSTTAARVRDTVQSYAEEYNSPDCPIERGIMLICYEDSCQLSSREVYGDHIRTALGIKRGGNLSPSSLEVLAIIAYNEPVTRVYVDTVRGVDSSYAVNSLVQRQLIEPCGKLDAPGRPLLYRTTKNFLRVFGLNSLSDLPAVSDAPPKADNAGTLPLEGFETVGGEAVGAEASEDGLAGGLESPGYDDAEGAEDTGSTRPLEEGATPSDDESAAPFGDGGGVS